jgi:hypothetical protein
MRPRIAGRARPFAPLFAVVALALIVATCGGAARTATPQPTIPPARTPAPTTATAPTPPAPTKVPGGNGATPRPRPGTFETAWGKAWDALPPGFPVPSGAIPADPGDPADGPVSGAFVVGHAPDDVVKLMQNGLAAAGYSTEAISGPLEDGSVVIDSVGTDPACRVQTRVRGLSGTTMVTVLFGAACPWG